MNKRGQAAMEFLMTYGWAILVVLVAIGALAYFGVLDPDKLIADKCVIAPGSGVSCDDFGAAGTSISVVIKNVGADAITVSEVSVSSGATADSADQDILAGETGTFTLTGATAGKKIKADLSVVFNKTAGVDKTAVGDLVVTVPAA